MDTPMKTNNFDYKTALQYAKHSILKLFADNKHYYRKVDVDEVMSMVGEKLRKYSYRFDNNLGTLAGYVKRISQHCWIDYMKQRMRDAKHNVSIEDNIGQDASYDSSPETEYISQENILNIENALNSLRKQDRIIIDYIMQGDTYQEIAQKTGKTVINIRTSTCRIREKLRLKLISAA